MFANCVFSWIGDLSEAGFDKVNPAFGPCQPPRKIMDKFGLAGFCAEMSFLVPFSPTLMPDVQRLAQEAARQNGNVEIQVASPLDGHPALLEALLDRASEALTPAKDRG